MIRLVLSVWFTFLGLCAYSQHLNKIGKIEVDEIPTMPEYRVQKIDSEYKVIKDSFVFEGNSFYKVSKGFITSLEVFDNKKDYIKHYNSEGKLLVTILSDRIINLKTSKIGNKLAFHNSENIILINLNNYNLDTLNGSFVYSFIEEDFIYYNPAIETINFKHLQVNIKEYPNQFVQFKGKLYVITKCNIYELIGSSLVQRYKFNGEFFDAKLINEEFYIVDRTEKRKTESFSLYKTTNFSNFLLVDRLDELNR